MFGKGGKEVGKGSARKGRPRPLSSDRRSVSKRSPKAMSRRGHTSLLIPAGCTVESSISQVSEIAFGREEGDRTDPFVRAQAVVGTEELSSDWNVSRITSATG